MSQGDEESNYSVHQILSFLRGAYRDRDYNKAEKLLTLREAKVRDEMVVEVERLKKKVKEMEENVEKMELEKGLRKKAEQELKVAESKFEELEVKVLSMQKDIELLRSLEAGEKGSEMEGRNEFQDEAEVEAEAGAEVASDHFGKGSGVAEDKKVEATGMEGDNFASTVSADDLKQTVPEDVGVESEKQATNDRIPKNGNGSLIVISSSSDGNSSDLQIITKSKTDLAPVKLEFGGHILSDSDHGAPEVSSGLKRKGMSPNNKDKAESAQQTLPGQKTLPHSPIHKGKEPSTVSLNPPPGLGVQSSGKPQGTSQGPRNILDDEEYRKSLLDKLLNSDFSSSSDSSS